MTTKTHLTSIEEGVIESGIQCRIDEPDNPVTNQLWVNKETMKLKGKIDDEVYVFSKGTPVALELPSTGVMDTHESETFHKTTNGDVSVDISKIVSGSTVHLTVTNEGEVPSNLYVSGLPYIMDENSDLTIEAMSTTLFTFINTGTLALISKTEYR